MYKAHKNTLTVQHVFCIYKPPYTHIHPLTPSHKHICAHNPGLASHLARFHHARLSGRYAHPPPCTFCHLYMIFWVIITAIRLSSLSLFHFLFIGRLAASLRSSLFSALCSAGLYNREARQRRRAVGTACH